MLPLSKVFGGDNPADLMTKNVGIDLAIKHMTTMGIRFEQGRSDATAKLHSLEEDCWEHLDNGDWRKHSMRSRRELITPCGEEGQGGPARPHDLCSVRVTSGIAGDGTRFFVQDNWRLPGQAHRELEESWIGYTDFKLKATASTRTSTGSTSASTFSGTSGNAGTRSSTFSPTSSDGRRSILTSGSRDAELRDNKKFGVEPALTTKPTGSASNPCDAPLAFIKGRGGVFGSPPVYTSTGSPPSCERALARRDAAPGDDQTRPERGSRNNVLLFPGFAALFGPLFGFVHGSAAVILKHQLLLAEILRSTRRATTVTDT